MTTKTFYARNLFCDHLYKDTVSISKLTLGNCIQFNT